MVFPDHTHFFKDEVGTVKLVKALQQFSYRLFQGSASFVDPFCCLCISLPYCHVCFLQPCGHLLGKGGHVGSLVCDVFLCFATFPYGVIGSGVVLDCIDS